MHRRPTPFFIGSLIIILTVHTQAHTASLMHILSSLIDGMTPNLVCSRSMAPSPAQGKKYTMSRKQVEDYLDNQFAGLGYELYPNVTQEELTGMKNAVFNTLQYAPDSYIWVSGIRFYDKDKIDTFILDAIVTSIEQSSYTIAYNQTYNSTLATKVSQSIRKNVTAYIQKQSYLDPQKLKPYFGYALLQLVRERINQIDTPYQPAAQPVVHHTPTPSAPPLYESTSCCICMDSFSSTCKRIFLNPCGHDICESCALNWFFPTNMPDHTRTCPQCRSKVNFDTLYHDLGL